jgi:hypothetical protein
LIRSHKSSSSMFAMGNAGLILHICDVNL